MRSRVAAGAAPGWSERNGAICTRAPGHSVFEETELDCGSRIAPAPLDGVYVRALISYKEFTKLTPAVSPPVGDRSPRACWPYRLVVTLSNLRCHPAPVYLPGTADGHTLLRHCGGKEPALEIARRTVGTWYRTLLDRTPVPGGLSMW